MLSDVPISQTDPEITANIAAHLQSLIDRYVEESALWIGRGYAVQLVAVREGDRFRTKVTVKDKEITHVTE